MLTKETILEFRHFLESAQWGLFEEKVIKVMTDKAIDNLLNCPMSEVENLRGQIKALQILSALKLAARTAYMESKNDR